MPDPALPTREGPVTPREGSGEDPAQRASLRNPLHPSFLRSETEDQHLLIKSAVLSVLGSPQDILLQDGSLEKAGCRVLIEDLKCLGLYFWIVSRRRSDTRILCVGACAYWSLLQFRVEMTTSQGHAHGLDEETDQSHKVGCGGTCLSSQHSGGQSRILRPRLAWTT